MSDIRKILMVFALFTNSIDDWFMANTQKKSGGLQDFANAKTETEQRTGNAPGLDQMRLVGKTEKKLEEMKKVFGKNLARIRRESGYSQLSLSLEINMTHNFINELEQGNKGASFLTLAKLEIALRTPVHKFFEPEKEEANPDADVFLYPDAIDKMVGQLHETIDTWNNKRVK
jgi:transcriptional regulator with XRE-family HTH domain